MPTKNRVNLTSIETMVAKYPNEVVVGKIFELYDKLCEGGFFFVEGSAVSPATPGLHSSSCIATGYGNQEGPHLGSYKLVSLQENSVKWGLHAHVIVTAVERIHLHGVNNWHWDFKGDLSHDCHNRWCLKTLHIRPTDKPDNTKRTARKCILYVECPQCLTRTMICPCEPKCRAKLVKTCVSCTFKAAEEGVRISTGTTPPTQLGRVPDPRAARQPPPAEFFNPRVAAGPPPADTSVARLPPPVDRSVARLPAPEDFFNPRQVRRPTPAVFQNITNVQMADDGYIIDDDEDTTEMKRPAKKSKKGSK